MDDATEMPTGWWRRAVVPWIVLVVIVVVCVFVLPRIERYLLVSACSIAYVAEDERIHLTNEWGTVHVELEGPAVAARAGRPYSPPAWSPGGKYVGYQCLNAWEGTSHVAVLNPWSGERWIHASERGARFLGWVDDETWAEGNRARDARTGEVRAELPAGETEAASTGKWPFGLSRVAPVLPGETLGRVVISGRIEEGSILANVREPAGWRLVILSREGKLLRRIVTDVRPKAETVAAWRRASR